MRITLENVTHTYSVGSPLQSTAIKNINLTVEQGEFLALIGPTGSGKSTLAQHLNGLLMPTEGKVLLDGQDIHAKGYSKKELRQKVGMLFQYPEHQLFEETVEKDIAFGPKNLGLSPEEISARVTEAMERVGLPLTDREKSPFELSGGQMRRVALAGVLAMRPQALVLDEPAAGLDPKNRQNMLELISGLHDKGITIVMVSHSMDDVAQYATRAAVLEKGVMVMNGTPAAIFSDTERLTAMGLDVPAVCRLGMLLREKGLPFPAGVFRQEDAIDALRALLKGGHGHA